MSFRSPWPLLLALASLVPGGLGAQTCPQGAIAAIGIVNRSIFDPAELSDERRFRWAYQLAN